MKTSTRRAASSIVPASTRSWRAAERAKTDGVIVSKLDRLSRPGVADALKLVEQITEDGGSIAAFDLGLASWRRWLLASYVGVRLTP